MMGRPIDINILPVVSTVGIGDVECYIIEKHLLEVTGEEITQNCVNA